ncbi:MAG: EamA family transporter [Actinomycetota bacterium]
MTAAPEALAAFSAFCFAGSHIASKRGVESTSVVAGDLISLATGWLLLLVATTTRLPSEVSLSSVAILAAAGLLAPAIARASAIAGIDRLGPSVSVPVQASIYPLFAIVGAALLLSESVGALSVVLGGILVAT